LPSIVTISTDPAGSIAMLKLSQKLRSVVYRMQTVTIVSIGSAICFLVLLMLTDARHGVLPNIVFGLVLLAFSAVPSIGISGICTVRAPKLYTSASRIGRVSPTLNSEVVSTDVGTLGG
jgi:hypothetical protein